MQQFQHLHWKKPIECRDFKEQEGVWSQHGSDAQTMLTQRMHWEIPEGRDFEVQKGASMKVLYNEPRVLGINVYHDNTMRNPRYGFSWLEKGWFQHAPAHRRCGWTSPLSGRARQAWMPVIDCQLWQGVKERCW